MSITQLKSTIIYFSLATLSLVIIFTSLFAQATAQTNKQLGLATPRPSVKPQTPVDILVPRHGNYSLADPGMLPTHPLYPLKMITARLRLITTFNPERRARLLLDYSNLRMSAADKLIRQGEIALAISTATKGQNYIWQAINHSNAIPASLQSAWYTSLEQSLLKHEEVLEKIRLVATDNSRHQADKLIEQLATFRQQVINLSGKPFIYPRPEDLPSLDSSTPYL